MEFEISICTYNDGLFEVMLSDNQGNQVTLSGVQKLNEQEFEFVNRIAPACVWTKYKEIIER